MDYIEKDYMCMLKFYDKGVLIAIRMVTVRAMSKQDAEVEGFFQADTEIMDLTRIEDMGVDVEVL